MARKNHDTSTVRDTINFLDRQIMLQKFVLRAVIKKRNRLEREQMEVIDNEIATRARIDSLENRMALEVTSHPEMFPQNGQGMDGHDI